MINKIFKDQRMKQQIRSDEISPIEKPKFASMQYIPRLSENISRTLRSCIPTLNIAPKPTRKLNNAFSNMKAKIQKEDTRDVIYGLQCEDKTCRKNKYIGQTYRRVGIRTEEHSKDYDNRHKPGGKTAVIRHALEMEKEQKKEHKIDFSIDQVQILDRESNKFKREFIESTYIRMTGERANNFRRDTNNLHGGYTNILNLYKDIQSNRKIKPIKMNVQISPP